MKDSESCTWPKADGDLHQPAELDHLVEIARGRDDERKHDRQLGIAGGEPSQLFAAQDDPPPIADDPVEAGLEVVEFAPLAAVERDVLGILAQPHQAEAEIGLVALLIEARAGSAGGRSSGSDSVPTTA